MKLRDVRRLFLDAMHTGKITAEVVLWIDRLRMTGWPSADVAPFDYDDLFAFVRDGAPNIQRPEWDAFLAECDNIETDRVAR